MIDNIVLKIAAPCNLKCTYCYEYNTGDESWRNMPKQIDNELVEILSRRVEVYCNSNKKDKMNITLHGGEPLLLNPRKLDELLTTVRMSARSVNIKLAMQTNAVLLNAEFIKIIKKHRIHVGVSLDGNEYDNRHRIRVDGKSSFQAALNGYAMLQNEAPEFLSGILAVVNVNGSAADTINYLCSLRPRQIDLLLPFETHDTLGVLRKEWSRKLGHWFQEAFDTWYSNPEYSKSKIRIFEDVLQGVVTKKSRTDWFGSRRVSYLVVGTNGDYDILDHLKVIGAASEDQRSTKTNIYSHSISEAENAAKRLLIANLAHKTPSNCMSCNWMEFCKGGYLPHRFSNKNGFNNSSVACEALQNIFSKSDSVMSKYI